MSRSSAASLALVCALAFAGACASDDPQTMTPGAMACSPGTPGCTQAPAGPAAGGVSGAALPTGGSAPITTAGAVAPPVAGAGGGAAPGPALSVPCDVAQIVSQRCTGCHQNPTKIGAPMPLMTLADFQANAISDKTKKVYQIIPGRLDPADPTKRMPQPPLDALTMPEKTTFNTWLNAGAQGAMNGCAIKATELAPIGGTDGGVPMTGTSSGHAHITEITYDDPDMKCYKFLTHAAGDMSKPYVQGLGEQYVNFDFKAPWTGTVYERATKLANDPKSKVIHHWLLFKQSGPVTDGAVSPGSGIHPDGTLIHAWGPGASPLYFDADVGVPLESTVGYRLEAHFNNATGGSGEDNSGAEVCVTPKKPEHVAELVWVGTDSIAGTSAQGSCAPRGPFPIHIIAAQPHMHKLGTKMNVVVNRAGGMKETVHDKDFSFDSQQYYVEDFVLNQGDTMTTTCTYSGFATFGMNTSNEMCYFFSLAWPAGSLRSAGGAFIHGQNSCM